MPRPRKTDQEKRLTGTFREGRDEASYLMAAPDLRASCHRPVISILMRNVSGVYICVYAFRPAPSATAHCAASLRW